jgi:stage III sporulation protein AD
VALKAVGIGYITEFAADTAIDGGQTALSSKITLAGRTLLFIIALPVIKDLLSLAVRLVE